MKKIFGPFYPYTPLESYAEEQTKIVLDVSPTGPFFYDEGTGKDYYVIAKELRDQLAKSSIDHAFISLDTENRVCCVSHEAFDACTPFNGWHILVIPAQFLPDKLEEHLGDVAYEDGAFTYTYFRAKMEAVAFKNKQMNWASQYIQSLEELEELTGKPLTEHKQEILKNLKIYRCELLDVDPQQAPNIVWPEQPAVF